MAKEIDFIKYDDDQEHHSVDPTETGGISIEFVRLEPLSCPFTGVRLDLWTFGGSPSLNSLRPRVSLSSCSVCFRVVRQHARIPTEQSKNKSTAYRNSHKRFKSLLLGDN